MTHLGGINSHPEHCVKKSSQNIKGNGNMKRVTVKAAAEILGVSPQFVRMGLQRGTLPIGTAVKMSSVWTYYISEERLRRYAKGDDIQGEDTL